jgi:dolichol kinase
LKKRPEDRGTEKVILPLDGRPNGPVPESVFVERGKDDISLLGEILRKMTHLGAISIPTAYYFFDIISLWFFTGGLIFSLSTDMIRFFGNEPSKKFIYRYFGIIIRPHEKKNFTGATYILVSSIITILLFDKIIAVIAIAFIVLGDTAGAIIGRLWGKVKFRGKSLEGSVSFFLACSVVALIVPGVPFWVKIAGAFTATVVEALTLYTDDNLTVPLISGALMQLIVSQLFVLEHFS